jgi:arylsulfatase/uncharacterized sulfatase
VPATGEVSLSIALAPNGALARMAAAHVPARPERLAQKEAYLKRVARTPLASRPNVVVILFDDLGYGDLSSYGNRLIRTPNMDALARRGARLTQFYASSPVCTPSRAGLMTGRYPTRSRSANHVFFPTGSPVATLRQALGYQNAILRDEILLPEVLARAGYATGAFGKWHLGDTPGHRPTDLGFGAYFGGLYSNDMDPFALYRGVNIDTPADKVDQGTLSQRFTDEAIGFIRANAARPFFAYIPYTGPHVPHHRNPRRRGSQAGLYGDIVEDLDDQVGRVVRELDALKLSDNTLVVITSDNGGDYTGSAGPLRGRKGETFEGGMRVPAIVVWPGRVPAGSTVDGMSMNIDLLPTVLAALGLPQPGDRTLDGRDIGPMLQGRSASPHAQLFYVSTWSGEYEAVRDTRFKYRDRTQKTGANPFFPPRPS